MRDSNRDISTWTQSGTVGRCGYLPAKGDMGSTFWAKVESQIGTGTRYLFVRLFRDAADLASRDISEGVRAVFSGKQGATKDKRTETWSVCLDANSFGVLAGTQQSHDDQQFDESADDQVDFDQLGF